MANSEWTKEERERAAEQIHFRRIVKWSENLELSAVAMHNSYVEEIQMELNRLQEEVREAREIIEQYPKAVRDLLSRIPVRNVPHLKAAAEAWLSRNK